MLKPPPFTENGKLRDIGITIGEGSTVCIDRSPTLEVKMCDRKAVETVAKSWGTSVYRTIPLQCRPTDENPEGRQYATKAAGLRAETIMKGYEPEIRGTEIHGKWLKALEQCAKRQPKKRTRRKT